MEQVDRRVGHNGRGIDFDYMGNTDSRAVVLKSTDPELEIPRYQGRSDGTEKATLGEK